MNLKISGNINSLKGTINLTASKSESNRALIIRELCDQDFTINNLSESDDTRVLKELLEKIKKGETVLNVGIAGTVMRFLTAYLSTKDGEYILTGEDRMKERPIKVLVDALNQIGANISYQENIGYPPLIIIGNELKSRKIKIDGSVSSQYISALIMIAPTLQNTFEIVFEGEIISKPYINITINMMRYFGVEAMWSESSILIDAKPYKAKDFYVEADWSSASYWYGIAALADDVDISLLGLRKDSLQGDSKVVKLYENFGVNTHFIENGVKITKNSNVSINNLLELDFIDCPDIAQTVAVTCAALNLDAKFTGLKTLRIKETDRVLALQKELNKLGYNVSVKDNDLYVNKYSVQHYEWENVSVKTYNDHRMAMAFSPFALLSPLTIENPEVVSKSYPNFWNDLESVGFNLSNT